jgi:hypothetical protein
MAKNVFAKDAIYISLDNVYASLDDPNVIIDCFTKRYELLKNCSKIVNTFNDDQPVYKPCSYTTRLAFAARLYDKEYKYFDCIYESIPLNHYKEDYKSGIFYHKDIPESDYQEIDVVYRKVKNAYYNSTGDLKKDYLMGVKSPSFNITEGKRYKFGLELETIYGRLPEYLDNYLNYNAVHDGSLRGPNGEDPVGAEYVTGVLMGDTGFLQAKRLSVEVTRRCKIDKKCGMHLHLSGIDFSKENLVALYKVYWTLEKSIFSILPKSRYKNTYCRVLPILPSCIENTSQDTLNSVYEYNLFITRAYDQLFNFVSSDYKPSYKFNKRTEHPLGYKCGYKHNSARYCWLNFVPAIFDTKHNLDAKTIEIRNHSATTNYRKIKNWTLIHMGILWYVENYKRDIFSGNILSLEQIMLLAYPKTGKNILNYINERVSLFSSPTTESEFKQVELNDYEETNEDELLTVKGAMKCV